MFLRFFIIFFLQKILYIKNQPNFNFSTLSWDAVRLHPEVENRESKYDCSSPFGFRDMAFFMIFS